MNISRGDIVLANLEPSKGSEQGKERPVLVLQNDVGNKHSPTTIVAALTTSYDKIYPMNVEIKSSNSDLEKDSLVMLNQIFTIDIKSRIQEKFGNLSEDKMDDVESALRISLGLRGL